MIADREATSPPPPNRLNVRKEEEEENTIGLIQPHPQIQHLRIIRGAQARHRIPTRCALETRGPTPLIPALDHVVEDLRVRVRHGVDEADAVLLLVQPGLVDQRQDRPQGGRGGGGAVDLGEGAVDGDDVVGSLLLEPARLAFIFPLFSLFLCLFFFFFSFCPLSDGEGKDTRDAGRAGRKGVCLRWRKCPGSRVSAGYC